METQQKKAGFSGMESGSGSQGKLNNVWRLVLRVLALLLTLIAAVMIGVNKQTKIASIKIIDSLPPVNIPVTAKSSYLSVFVKSTLSNAIGCAHAGISLLLLIATRGRNKGLVLMVTVLDLLMAALQLSSSGVAGATGLMGYQGNSSIQWNKVCNVFGQFCRKIGAAVALSLLAAIAFLWLVVLALLTSHKIS